MKQDLPTLVLGGSSGKTGRRVAERLWERNLPVRIGSRSATPAFDWEDPSTWEPVLQGVGAVYITYFPDLAVPGAAEAVGAFARLAASCGATRLVLLSGRGEEEAQRSEKAVQEAGVPWTILRANWFSQNFSESFLRDQVLAGEVAFPVGDVREPFVDVNDIADVAVAALTEDGHEGQVYVLSGPRALTFAEAAEEIAQASGRPLRYQQISGEEFTAALATEGMPEEAAAFLAEVLTQVLDGRNSEPADGVQRALGREPKDFSDYARDAAATGVWEAK